MDNSPTQADFPTLVLSTTEFDNEWMDDIEFNEVSAQGRENSSKEGFSSIHCEKDTDMSTAAMLSACTLAAATRLEYLSAVGLDRPSQASDESMYDPTRPVPYFAPPKRYFRRFWISTSRRLLQLDVSAAKN